MIYCIDTSSLIHGWNEKYPPEVFASLWDNIQNLIDHQILVSCEEVLMELNEGADKLSDWASKQTDFFLPPDNDIQLAVGSILADPINSKVLDKKKVGKTEADPFVIATAQVKKLTVVSDETRYVQPQDIITTNKKISIRNVCENMNIRHLTLLELIKEQKWRF
jgi:hypothetical protein